MVKPFVLSTWLIFFSLFFCQKGNGQYILNGSAQKNSCNCYTLTAEKTFQSGSVWNSNKINLTSSFDFSFNVFLGCNDSSGADGIVFILQPNSTSIGNSGGGIGFGGVRPSIGIAIDTWQNFDLNDPPYDHISIQANGYIDHTNDLAGPVPVSLTTDNVEDCKWHILRIVWNTSTQKLQAYFDGALRVEKGIDLVTTIFNGDPNVFWGFTGATGGYSNRQQFCTALNPHFGIVGRANNACVDTPLDFRDSSESFSTITSYNWSFGDGTSSTEQNPRHVFRLPGDYPVNLHIIGKDGCENDSTIHVVVGSVPAGRLSVNDTCHNFLPTIRLDGNNTGVTYKWSLDGQFLSNEKEPKMSRTEDGNHNLEVLITSLYGCGQPVKTADTFVIKPVPVIDALVINGCVNEPLQFEGMQKDSKTTILGWKWNFGDNTGANAQRVAHRYPSPADYAVRLWSQATNGCISDTVQKSVAVFPATVFAGPDTSVIKGVPFQLNGAGNGTLLWSPAAGLSDPSSAKPVTTLSSDQIFVLTVTTAKGCVAKDTVLVRTFNGPAIYVPSAFTPNGDGKNDRFRPVYVGIKELHQFTVFNRWGGIVFTTRNMQQGWDGKEMAAGTYAWLVQAVNTQNQPMLAKGTVTLIR